MMIATEFNYETRCKGEGFGQHPCDMTESYAKKDRTCINCGRTDTGLEFPDCEWYKREHSTALVVELERSIGRLNAHIRRLEARAAAEYDKLAGWEAAEG